MSDFSGKHSFFGVKRGWGEDFFNRFFFNRGGVRVLGLDREKSKLLKSEMQKV